MLGREKQVLASYLGWWHAAGLVDAVADSPRNWLERAAPDPEPTVVEPRRPDQRPRPVAAPAFAEPRTGATTSTPGTSPTANWPSDLAAFDDWLASAPEVPGASWSMRRILPSGPALAPLMVLSDVPDGEDVDAGALLTGAAGRLLDAMLAAIGLSRDGVRLGSIAITRPPGGGWGGDNADALRSLALHHIRLAQPQRLLLLGQSGCQLLSGLDVPPDGTPIPPINHSGATVAAVAIHHPRLLLQRPMLKRPAWAALKCLRDMV